MLLTTLFENGSGVKIEHYMVLATALFVIGVFGVLYRKNAIILLMCIELMLNSVNLLLVAFSTYFGQADGQMFVFFIMVVAAAEATVGLSILVLLFRNTRSVDIRLFNKLKN
ncbi:MAG TPA: NADH-quinone oxidoreductase subunit NuoK [Fluviicola sp.]|nr:NADH-quinone oxidoreductase subunit NuoK [Fluviicola sp.]